MQKLPFVIASVMFGAALAALGAAPAQAQSQTGVSLVCGTNYCQASVSSPTSPLPFQYTWSYTGTAHLSSPFSCNRFNRSSCSFHCYQPYQDQITMRVSVADANGAFVGEASANAICNGSIGDQ